MLFAFRTQQIPAEVVTSEVRARDKATEAERKLARQILAATHDLGEAVRVGDSDAIHEAQRKLAELEHRRLPAA